MQKILIQTFLHESFDSGIHDFVVCKKLCNYGVSIVSTTFALSIIYTYWTLEDAWVIRD